MEEIKDFVTKLPLFTDSPFPELTDVSPNAKTVAIIKNLIFSKRSEMTAICTYLFQHWISAPLYPGIAYTFEIIGEVEMTHLEALSNAIVAFGGNPNFCDTMGNFWSARYNIYEKNLSKALEENIIAEKYAIEDYEKAIELVDNESLKDLFKRIIEDEVKHIEVFKDILKRV